MNRNQTDGLGKQIKGSVKEATSKLTRNRAGQAEGKVEKNIGKAQTKLGNTQERVKRDMDADRRNR